MPPHASAVSQPAWGHLLVSWIASVNARAPIFVLGPILPSIIDDLGLSFTVAGSLPGASLALMGLLAIPGGFLADRFGARRLMAGSLAVIALGGVVRSLAPGAGPFVLVTFLIGAAIGLMQPALASVAREAWPLRVGLATAIYSNGFVVGTYLGPALAPMLLALSGPAGWRGVLLAWGLFGAVSTLGAVISARGDRGSGHPHLLRPQSVFAIYAIRGVPALTVVLGSQSAIYYALGAWLPAYLQSHGWSVAAAAGPTSLAALAAIPAGLVAPSLSDVVGRRPLVVLAGLTTLLAQAGLLAVVDGWAWVWGALAGAGTTAAFTVSLAAPAQLAPAGRVGAAAGGMLALAYVGSMVGPFAVGALRDLTGGYQAGFWALLGLALVMTVAALGVPTARRSVEA